MVKEQPTSGSSLSEELIKYIEVNRHEIDQLRFGTITIKVLDGVLYAWTQAPEKRRGKEIDYL